MQIIFAAEILVIRLAKIQSRDLSLRGSSVAGIPDRPRASSYEPGNQAGSVTETNSVVCSYGKFQSGRPG